MVVVYCWWFAQVAKELVRVKRLRGYDEVLWHSPPTRGPKAKMVKKILMMVTEEYRFYNAAILHCG